MQCIKKLKQKNKKFELVLKNRLKIVSFMYKLVLTSSTIKNRSRNRMQKVHSNIGQFSNVGIRYQDGQYSDVHCIHDQFRQTREWVRYFLRLLFVNIYPWTSCRNKIYNFFNQKLADVNTTTI
jgi:hypothetical protein